MAVRCGRVRSSFLALALLPGALAVGATDVAAQGTLRVAMTVADIPLTTGQPDQGFEGYRFTGYTIYDALVNWNLSSASAPSRPQPGLATEWHVDPADKTRWLFKLRQGVTFHDGSPFNADAVIWNLDKNFNDKAPQYDPKQSAQVRGRIPSLDTYRKIDDQTVELKTRTVDAFFAEQVSYVLYSSPAQWEKLGRDWNKVGAQPSGTGPFKVDRVVPRERIEMSRNAGYWDPKRTPKLDKLILLPIPEASTRTSALLSGQVDWIEAPSPDAIDKLKETKAQIVTNIYQHIWPYEPSRLPGSPWNDIRVRKAVNLAIDRDGLTELLRGTMKPAVGYVYPDHPWFGNPTFKVRYDPAEAKKLLAEAGYSKANPLRLKVGISTSGSGQMQPLPMNEYIQQNLAAVDVDLQFEVLEWETLRSRRRVGAQNEVNRGITAINNSYGTLDAFTAFVRQFDSTMLAPVGFNWGNFKDEEVDGLIRQAQNAFDPAEQDKVLAKLHAKIVDEAAYVFVAHDLNPRALGANVRGFVQAQSWFQDLTPVYMAQ